MNTEWIILGVGWVCFLGFAVWCVYKVLKMAHDEDPGCLNLLKH